MAGDPWWSADHEKNFYEAIIVVFLVMLAMLFEDVFHAVTHSAEHSYAYGASKDTHQNEEDRAHQHRQPFKELAQHLGTEFMTLGFLACVIFLCNIGGFFDFLENLAGDNYGDTDAGYSSGSSYSSSNSSYTDDAHRRRLAGADAGMGLLIGPLNVPMPRTAGDWLHLTEEVHIRMFFGMVIYFSIVFSIIKAGVARIKEWAELTNRKILMELNKLHDIHDSSLTEYQELTKYTIVHMVNWQKTDEERWERLTLALYGDDADFMPDGEQDLREEVKTKLSQQFSLGHYLASTLEDAVVDIIELHRVTWVSLMVLFLFFMFLHQQKVKMIYIAGVILLLGIFGMGLSFMQVKSQDRDIESSAHTCAVKEKGKEKGRISVGSSSPANSGLSKGQSSKIMNIPGVRFSQFVFLRIFETTIFVWCYSFASIIFNKQGWENEFLVSLVNVLLYTIFTFVATSFLPTVVTHLFIQYSLPPYLDEHHMKILIRTIGDDDPALLDLARTGADEIKQAVGRVNVRSNTSHTNMGPFRVPSGFDVSVPLGGLRNRAPTDVSMMSGVYAEPTSAPAYPSSPSRLSPTLVATPPARQNAPPVPGSLSDALSGVLATQEGLDLVQRMLEEAARVRLANIQRSGASDPDHEKTSADMMEHI